MLNKYTPTFLEKKTYDVYCLPLFCLKWLKTIIKWHDEEEFEDNKGAMSKRKSTKGQTTNYKSYT
jgi:hypothetical protein